jgi:deoxyribodipyrimidine photolyase-like uncharacterized protein
MKNVFLLLAFGFGLNSLLFSQEIDMSESELQGILCTHWEVEYAVLGSRKITQKIGAADFEIEFKSDGTYQLIRENGKSEGGEWSYDKSNKYVELSAKSRKISRIKSIDKNKMVLIPNAGQNDPPGLPKLEVHFKSVK